LTSKELYTALEPKVTGFSVNIQRELAKLVRDAPVGELPEVVMGGEVKFTLPPVRQLGSLVLTKEQISTSKFSNNPEELVDFPNDQKIVASLQDYKELYVVEISDPLGTLYLDIHVSAYNYFEPLLRQGSLVLARGFVQIYTFGSRRGDIDVRHEVHLRAISIKPLVNDRDDDISLVPA
jgi:hypothetical protein